MLPNYTKQHLFIALNAPIFHFLVLHMVEIDIINNVYLFGNRVNGNHRFKSSNLFICAKKPLCCEKNRAAFFILISIIIRNKGKFVANCCQCLTVGAPPHKEGEPRTSPTATKTQTTTIVLPRCIDPAFFRCNGYKYP